MAPAGEYSVRYREYAEAIWELEEEGIPVIQARIADWLGVSRASVNEMVHRMADEGLLTVDDTIELTSEGRHRGGDRAQASSGRAISLGCAQTRLGQGPR